MSELSYATSVSQSVVYNVNDNSWKLLVLALKFVVIYFGETYSLWFNKLILIHTECLQWKSGRPEHIRQYFILDFYYISINFFSHLRIRTPKH